MSTTSFRVDLHSSSAHMFLMRHNMAIILKVVYTTYATSGFLTALCCVLRVINPPELSPNLRPLASRRTRQYWINLSRGHES